MNRIKRLSLIILLGSGLMTAACGHSPVDPGTTATVTISVNPTTALANNPVSILWISQGVTPGTCSIPGVITNGPANGQLTTPPLTTPQTYQMTCKASDGSTVSSNTVPVDILPPQVQNELTLVSCNPPAGSTITIPGRITCTLRYVALQKGTISMAIWDDNGIPRNKNGQLAFIDPGSSQVQIWAEVTDSVVSHTSQLIFFMIDSSGVVIKNMPVSAGYTWK